MCSCVTCFFYALKSGKRISNFWETIIDCSQGFIETPSSLELQAICWSYYKHHSTFKFFIGITSNDFISYVSNCCGGRASDKLIVNDSRFVNRLEPYDQVMADRGFKIRDGLAMFQVPNYG